MERNFVRFASTAAVLAWLLTPAFANLAFADAKDDFAGFDEVKEDALSGEASTEGPKDAGELVARMHPALVHMPIAWLVLLLIVDVLAVGRGVTALSRPGFYLLVLTIASFIPALVSGFLNLPGPQDHSKEAAAVFVHRNYMLASFMLCVVALALRSRTRGDVTGKWRPLYLGIVFISVVLVTVGGHLGGRMVYGEHYLPF